MSPHKLDAPPTPADSAYGYTPTKYVTIVFIVLFGLSSFLHFVQAARYKLWYLLPTAVLCGLLEVLGWSGRLWSSINLFNETPFLMQITTTIIAPTPLLAANFVILGRIIDALGRQYSRLPSKWYTVIFCSADLVALVVQGTGGGLASTALDQGRDPNKGGHIILGGIVFQLVVILIYASCAAEFYYRYIKDRPAKPAAEPAYRGVLTTRMAYMSFALFLSTFLLVIRSIYRTIELANGWTGTVIRTQVYFNVFDGAMVVLAMYTTNVLHPGIFLKEAESIPAFPLQEKTLRIAHSSSLSTNEIGHSKATPDASSSPGV